MIKSTSNLPDAKAPFKKYSLSSNRKLYLSGLINPTQIPQKIALNHYPTYTHLPSYSPQPLHQRPNHTLVTFGLQGRSRNEAVGDHSKNKPNHQKVTFHHNTAGKDTKVLFLKNYQDQSRISGSSKIIFNYSSPLSNIETPTSEYRNLFCDLSQKTIKGKYGHFHNDIGLSQKSGELMKDSPETSIFGSSEIIPIPQVHSMENLSQEMEDLFKDDHDQEKQIHQASSAVKQLEELFQE